MKAPLLLLMLTLAQATLAQGRNANIVFSDDHWIQFQGGSPTNLIGANASIANGAVASISDTTGQLQFYCSGPNLRNGGHMPIPGSSVLASAGAGWTQDRLAMPEPGTPGQYLLFCIGSASWNTPPRLSYVEVDMNANGGVGNVSSPSISVLADSVPPKFMAVPHANGVDTWILVHPYLSNEFHAFLVTANGVSTPPVISSTGPVVVNFTAPGPLFQNAGPLVASPNGRLLAMACFDWMATDTLVGTVDLFNFNDSTGTVAHIAVLDSTRDASGLAFSPGSDHLYVHQYELVPSPNGPYGWRVLQYDISDPDAATINGSMITLDQEDSCTYGGGGILSMLAAPDGRIYIRTNNEPVTKNILAVIDQPDSLGLACGYQRNGFFVTGQPVQTFPNQMRRYNEGMNIQTGVPALASASSTQVRPNPLHGAGTLVLDLADGPVVLRWCDLLGRTIKQQQAYVQGGTIALYGTEIPAGLYMLQVRRKELVLPAVRVLVE